MIATLFIGFVLIWLICPQIGKMIGKTVLIFAGFGLFILLLSSIVGTDATEESVFFDIAVGVFCFYVLSFIFKYVDYESAKKNIVKTKENILRAVEWYRENGEDFSKIEEGKTYSFKIKRMRKVVKKIFSEIEDKKNKLEGTELEDINARFQEIKEIYIVGQNRAFLYGEKKLMLEWSRDDARELLDKINKIITPINLDDVQVQEK